MNVISQSSSTRGRNKITFISQSQDCLEGRATENPIRLLTVQLGSAFVLNYCEGVHHD